MKIWLISLAETRRAVSSLISAFTFRTIHRSVANIISCIHAQKSTATYRYSLSYGPEKLDDAMACFEVETRRAITFSILVRSPQLFHKNVAHYVVYNRANRDVAKTTGSYQKTVKKSGVLARRHVSWFVFFEYNTQNSTFGSVRHPKSTNSHAARFHA